MMQGGCDIKSGGALPMVPLVDYAQVAITTSPDVLLIIDSEGILRWASPSVALLGYDPVEQIGTQVLDYVHPDDLGYALGMLTEAVRRPGEHSPPVFRVLHGDGGLVEVEAAVANVDDGRRVRRPDARLCVPLPTAECSPVAGAASRSCCRRSRRVARARSAKTSRP